MTPSFLMESQSYLMQHEVIYAVYSEKSKNKDAIWNWLAKFKAGIFDLKYEWVASLERYAQT